MAKANISIQNSGWPMGTVYRGPRSIGGPILISPEDPMRGANAINCTVGPENLALPLNISLKFTKKKMTTEIVYYALTKLDGKKTDKVVDKYLTKLLSNADHFYVIKYWPILVYN